MQTAQITGCQDCQTLKTLYVKIEGKLRKLITNKLRILYYNDNAYFDASLFKSLMRYRRIVEHRMFNPSYASDFSTQQIIGRINSLINK